MKQKSKIEGLEDHEIHEALQDEHIKLTMQEMMKKKLIQLVNKHSNEPMFKKEIALIGEKGDRALNESPQVEQDEIDPANAKLHVEKEAFDELQSKVDDFIRKNNLKKQ